MPESTDLTCEHLGSVVDLGRAPQAFCEECLGDVVGGVVLRVCLTCGHVGCGEGSPSDHAAQHYAETDHPIAAAVERRATWRWCYPHGRPV
jgi:uncharacterized UBP type Zn finger protein